MKHILLDLNFVIQWIILAGILAACSTSGGTEPSQMTSEEGVTMAIELTSPAFEDGEAIPVKYSCDGEDISPALSWKNLPAGTESLALIVDDPDAPGGTWVHWVAYDIPRKRPDFPRKFRRPANYQVGANTEIIVGNESVMVGLARRGERIVISLNSMRWIPSWDWIRDSPKAGC
jgi:hypothetical protein